MEKVLNLLFGVLVAALVIIGPLFLCIGVFCWNFPLMMVGTCVSIIVLGLVAWAVDVR